MSVYAATLGELIIIEGFVFWLWLQVLAKSIIARDGTAEAKKVLLTSIGLVLNALAIFGIISWRVYELVTGYWPFVWGVVAFYVMLAIGNVMFILSASLGGNLRLLKCFLLATGVWVCFCAFMALK